MADALCLPKLPGRATTEGQQYEYKLAGLLNLRARRRSGLRFQLATNVAGAEPCDDVLIRFFWDEAGAPRAITYLVQLKHAKDSKKLHIGSFTGEKGDYSLKKYFEVYKRLAGFESMSSKVTSESKDYLKQQSAEDYRFVIYTTKVTKHISCDSEEQSLPNAQLDTSHQSTLQSQRVDFPFCDMLSSQEGDIGFTFSQKHETIWNLLNGDPHEDMFRNMFLPRLKVFGGQKNANELDAVIRDELSNYFELNQTQVEAALREYIASLSEWWERDDGEVWTDLSSLLEDIIAKDLNAAFHRESSKHDLRFSTQAHQNLAQKIRDHRFIVMSVPGVKKEARCIKLKQVLDSIFSGSKVLWLQQNSFQNMCRSIFKISQKFCDGDITIINVEDSEETICKLIGNLSSETESKVIILTSDTSKDLRILKQLPMFCLIEDRWCLHEVESQEIIMGCSLLFQGRKLQLGDLQNAWPTIGKDVDGPMLLSLLEGTAALGSSLQAFQESSDTQWNGDGESYIARILHHKPVVRDKALFLKSNTDIFALSGFPKKYIEKLSGVRRAEREQFPSVSSTTEEERGWKILSTQEQNKTSQEDKEQFDKLCSLHTTQNIHHLSYIDHSIIWTNTYGSPSKIVQYLPSPFCQPGSLCVHNDSDPWNENTLFLSGEPGIGKTTFVSFLATRESPRRWSVYLSLISQRHLLHDLPSSKDIQIGHVVGLLAEAVNASKSSSPSCATAFLKNSLFVSGELTVYIDGVDEVCPLYKDKVMSLIRVLQKQTKGRIWVTARSHLDGVLRRMFKDEPLVLKPFSEEDQINHIFKVVSRKWKYADEGGLRSEVIKAVQVLNRNTRRSGRGICDVPLYAQLVAESFEEWQTTANFTLLKLYELFIKKKMAIYVAKQFRERHLKEEALSREEASFMEQHKNAAVLLFEELKLFADHEALKNSLTVLLNADDSAKTGILYFSEGVPKFVHHTFAEYFGGLWLKDNFKKGEFTEGIWQGLSSPLRYFFDALLAEGFKLHHAAIDGDIGSIAQFLMNGGCNDVDAGGRTALHLGAMYRTAEACSLLLNAGSDVCIEDEVLHWTPMRYADALMNLSVADALLGSRASEEAGRSTRSQKHEDDMKNIITRNIADGEMIRLAARHGHVHLINFFLDMKKSAGFFGRFSKKWKNFSNEGSADSRENTPLHLAVMGGHLDVVECFTRAGASVNVQNSGWQTPLHLALRAGSESMVKALIACGADVNAVESLEIPPLHFASKNGWAGIVEQILSAGCSFVDVPNHYGTPLLYASEKGHVDTVWALLVGGADANRTNYPESLATPLHRAAEHGHAAVAELLLNARANATAVDSFQMTPLHWAGYSGNVAIAEMLLECNAAVNARDRWRRTPLHRAAMCGRANVAELLLRRGADPLQEDHKGNTPLSLAMERNHDDIVALLLQYTAKD